MSTPTDRPLTLATAPIDVDTVKAALRFTSDSEDELLLGWIATAVSVFEEQTGGQIGNATWQYASDAVPESRELILPRPPMYGDVVITYDDVDGVAQTWGAENYVVHGSFLEVGSPSAPLVTPFPDRGRIVLTEDGSWPAINGTRGSFRVERTCGFGDEPPEIVKSALYLLVSHYHRNRSEVQAGGRGFDTLPMGAQSIINTFKWRWLPVA